MVCEVVGRVASMQRCCPSPMNRSGQQPTRRHRTSWMPPSRSRPLPSWNLPALGCRHDAPRSDERIGRRHGLCIRPPLCKPRFQCAAIRRQAWPRCACLLSYVVRSAAPALVRISPRLAVTVAAWAVLQMRTSHARWRQRLF
eukprot:scaffold304434_cov28-Tisochrysis_lutea.AAC.4